jgi:succinyl-CoA synthetase beta subunit
LAGAARRAASSWPATIKGLKVKKVLVDEAANIGREIYLGIVVDRTTKRVVMMASAEGGVEIEEVARISPEKIHKVYIDPFLGLQPFQAREVAFGIGVEKELIGSFSAIAQGLWRTFAGTDASLAEINPLVVTGDHKLLAVDGKIVLDDNGLFRHPDLAEMRDLDEEAPAETEARKNGLSYVKLDGNVGCMVNGAGLAMASMDVIKLFGGAPANFLDIGGGAKADKVAAALRMILSDPNVKSVLFNIFGGITRCDEVAKGILVALEQVKPKVPMVVRLVGTNEEEGRRLLADANMMATTSLVEAAKLAVAAAQG